MKPEDAEEYTQALGQVVAGGWRQIALAQRLGVPKALKLSVNDWVKQRLGGYVKYSIEERTEAVLALADEGFTEREISNAVGSTRNTIRKALGAKGTKRKEERDEKRKALGAKGTNDPIDTLTGLAANETLRREIERDSRREQHRADRQAHRAAAAHLAQQTTADTDATIRHESLEITAASMTPGSVALVFTDPPYHDKTLFLYRTLGAAAARVLRDGGSLITYAAQHRLPEIIGMLQAADLTFLWPLAMVHTGAKARMNEFGVIVNWKPLLWFVKGSNRHRDDPWFVNDLIESKPEKDAHPWQQGTVEARYYIEGLTQPGDLVFDPFCGGGTTAVAAAETARRWLTCDVDEEAVWIARQRLRDTIGARV